MRRVAFDASGLTAWDSALLTFLHAALERLSRAGVEADRESLPAGIQRLLALAGAVSEREGARRAPRRDSVLALVGETVLRFAPGAIGLTRFMGEATLAFLRFLVGRARFKVSDLLAIIQECGPQALPIVTLISFLVGWILAFVGAVQLQRFGAGIYVADLVGLAMAREMGAMMAAIIMAGRTGAAFAAQLGTMQVNEEIDAFTTFGIPAMEFLVLPRMLALALMMPLLCLYADFVGILGGAVVAVGALDLTFTQYFDRTQEAVALRHFGVGVLKSAVFGVLVAVAGCMRGMQCGGSSAAVGQAATSAVVTGIVFIIVADAIFTMAFHVLGI